MYSCKSALNFAAGETASATTAAVSAAAAANLAADLLRDSSRLDVSSSIGIRGFRSSSSSSSNCSERERARVSEDSKHRSCQFTSLPSVSCVSALPASVFSNPR